MVFKLLGCQSRVILCCLYNFPRVADFAWLNITADKPLERLVFVGAVSKPLGSKVMWEAMQSVLDVTPNATLTIIASHGSLSAELSDIQDQATTAGQSSCLRIIGPLPYQTIPEELAGYGIGWVPLQDIEKHHKNISTKMFEYMAVGIPIVGSDLPPVRRFVEDAECGILVTPGDPYAHARAILELIHHPDEANRLGQNGRRAFLEKYHWEQQSTNLLELYRHLLNTRSGLLEDGARICAE